GAKHATTSQPAPGDFVQVYEALSECDAVLSIHITGKLSGTLQTARIGADLVDGDKIRTFDSENASMGGGWQALVAVQALAERMPVDGVVKFLEEVRPQIATYLSLPTLTYLQRGGRVNLGKALIANLLSVKPVFVFSEGLLSPVAKARTMPGANKEMVAQLKHRFSGEPVAVAVLHAEDRQLADQLMELAKQELNVAYGLIEDLTASLVVHGGPGTVAIAVIPYKYVDKVV
ncbi:MAG TPA: DegV family protein, partial [Bacillota bacterium]|nr:DegV family protein [Bacillota bacterium]